MTIKARFQTIRRPLLGLSIVPIVCLALFVGTAWYLGHDVRSQLAWTEHSDDVIRQSHLLQDAVGNTQDALRAYVRTGSPKEYAAFLATAASIAPASADLRALVNDNGNQERLAVRLSTSAESETRAMSALMERMRAANRHVVYNQQELNARRTPRTDTSQETFENAVPAFENAEIELQQQRKADTDRLWLDSTIVLALGSVAALSITLFLNLTLGRGVVLRLNQLAEQASQFGSDRRILEPLPGDDELAMVSDAIHEMAIEIKRRDDGLTRYRMLAEHSRDSIFFFRSGDGRILEANPAAVTSYGYSLDELLSMTGFDLTLERLGTPYREREWNAEYTHAAESEHRRKDGTMFPVEIALDALTIEGQKIIMCVVRDLTERRAAQQSVRAALDQALEASRLKSVFVATMSHEIRTPMNGVIGMTELLLETSLTKEQHDFAETAQESAHALLSVINGILDFSKIEAGRLELEMVAFDLLTKIESIGAIIAGKAREKGISLVTFVDPQISTWLFGDPGRLRQVLMNLVDNAVKFTPKGTVSLAAELVSSKDATARVRFSVSDTGIGIEPENLATLFESFRQADGSTTRKYGGTGLGLAISKSLVELMGGTIEVTTSPRRGSTFTFSLDLAMGDPVERPPQRELTGLRALIVTDSTVTRDIVLRYATLWKVVADVADAPDAALESLRAAAAHGEPFDVAIVDLVATEPDGMNFGRSVRADPAIAATGLVLIAAFDPHEQGLAAIGAGYSGYLVKPVRQSQLHDSIADMFLGALAPEQTAPAAAPAVERPDLILLAEDNPVNRDVALRQLRKLGYTAESVVNGSEAVAAARKIDYDLIFMDCQMPVMDGFQATGAIRRREIRTGKHVPIVAMTANALPRDREHCLEAGMDDYLSKPIGLEDVRVLLDRWLGGEEAGEADGVLDIARVQDVFGDADGIAEFAGKVVPAIGNICDRIETSTELPQLGQLAHELKGAAANVGAGELASAAAALEVALGGATDKEELHDALASIQAARGRLNKLVRRSDGIFGVKA